mgnify:CR=1 FL=1
MSIAAMRGLPSASTSGLKTKAGRRVRRALPAEHLKVIGLDGSFRDGNGLRVAEPLFEIEGAVALRSQLEREDVASGEGIHPRIRRYSPGAPGIVTNPSTIGVADLTSGMAAIAGRSESSGCRGFQDPPGRW